MTGTSRSIFLTTLRYKGKREKTNNTVDLPVSDSHSIVSWLHIALPMILPMHLISVCTIDTSVPWLQGLYFHSMIWILEEPLGSEFPYELISYSRLSGIGK